MATDNNILQPISPDFNTFCRQNPEVFFNSITPPPLNGKTNVAFQFDQFGNVSACVSSSGSSIVLETNGVANGSQSILNLQEGTNTTVVDNGTGTITVSAPNAASIGTAGKLQMVGSTAGSFAASSLTDDGTNVSTAENFQVNSSGSGASITVNNSSTNGTGVLQIHTVSTTVELAAFGNTLPGVFGLIDVQSNTFLWSSNSSDDFFIALPLSSPDISAGTGAAASILHTGAATFASVALTAATTATSATAGAATALPITPSGYVEVPINGTTFKIPYFAV